MAMTDEQLATLYGHVGDSISVLEQWLNSEALWEVVAGTLGFILAATLIAMLITKIFSVFRFRARD